jgi:hypothetical protein
MIRANETNRLREDTYFPFTNPPESPNALTIIGENGFGGLMVNTEFWFDYVKNYDVYVRATTDSELFPAYIPINIKVCGNETLSTKSTLPMEYTLTPGNPGF